MPPTSPLATGGAGPDFESKVGAYYLAALLLEGPARGAAFGTTSNVKFQQAALGAPLDDITIDTESASGRHHFHLQLKHKFSFARSDRDFEPVIERCWLTLQKTEFAEPGNWVGVAIENFPAKVKEHFVRVSAWAQARASSADFFREIEIEGIASREMRAFVELISTHLRTFATEAASDDALWTFFKRLVIVDFDVMLDTSRDESHTLDALRRLSSDASVDGARALYERLLALARKGNQTAGGYTTVSLRERLAGDGIALSPPTRCAADLNKLAQETRQVLASIPHSIGGVVLDRSAVVEGVLERVDRSEFVILTGESGVGKSALLRSIAHARETDGPVIALSWTRLEGAAGWSGLASKLGVEHLLSEIIAALQGASRPCLVIDGVDRLGVVGAQEAVNDLIRAVTNCSAALRWAVVVTSQSEAIEVVRQWMHVPETGTATVTVQPLDDIDVKALGGALPHLADVLSSPKVGPIVRNPFFLGILEQGRAEWKRDQIGPVTEADVYDTWWENVVGHGSQAVLRKQAILRLGGRSLKERLDQVPIQEFDGNVLTGLVRDRVLTHDRDDLIRFGHDILEGWAIARVIGQQENPIRLLIDSSNPFWAFRSLQLLACARLEGEEGRERWIKLLEEAEREGAIRWTEAIITAPLISTRIGDLLGRVGDLLLAGSGTRVTTFLHALLATATRPDPVFAALLRPMRLTFQERTAALQNRQTPIVERWLPVMTWLAPLLHHLPYRAREVASRVMLLWQQVESPLPLRLEIAEAALDWRVIPRPSPGVFVYINADQQIVLDRLRDVVALSADVIPEKIPAFLQGLLREHRVHDLKRWLADSPQRGLAQYASTAYTDFTLDILTPDWRGEDTSNISDEEEDRTEVPSVSSPDVITPPYIRQFTSGQKDRDFEALEHAYEYTPPSFARGPFFILLKANELEGLRLVTTLTNRATAAWERRDQNYRQELRSREEAENTSFLSDEEPPLVLQLGDASRSFFGGQGAYLWFRHTGNGPDPACSSLMALELWMEQEIEGGRDGNELLRTVLRDSLSTSVIAVCVAMCLAYPEKCREAAMAFLSSPWIWEWEITRFSVEHSVATFSPSQFIGLAADPHEDLARSRNDRPQRKTEIRQLAMEYVLSPNASLREPVVAAIRNFPNDISMLSKAERANERYLAVHRERMERFASFAEPENYRFYQDASGQIVGAQYVAPPELQQRDAAALDRLNRTNSYYRLLNWVHTSRRTGKPDSSMTLAEAVEQARALSKAGDFTLPFAIDGEMEYARLEAIAGVAALLPELDASWMRSQALDAWCQDVLIAAALMPRERTPGSLSLVYGDPLLSATQGLLTLIRVGFSDDRSKSAALDLVVHENEEIGKAIALGLQGAWTRDIVFCRNAVALMLSVAVERGALNDSELDATPSSNTTNRRTRLTGDLLDNITMGKLPKSVSLGTLEPAQRLRTRYVVRALTSVPLAQVQTDQVDRAWVTDLIVSSLTWTIAKLPVDARNRSPSSYDFPYEWPEFLGDAVAWLADIVSESMFDQTFLSALTSAWPRTAPLMTEFLRSFSNRQLNVKELPEAAQRRWRSIADTIIPAESLPSNPRVWFDREAMESLELLVHVYHQRPVLPDEWGHAFRFEDLYQRWVEIVGQNPTAFRALVTFAAGPASTIPVSTLIGWLSSAVARMSDRERVWRERDTGGVVAASLAKIISRAGDEIRRDRATCGDLAALLEELGRVGVTLATQLREQI